MGFARDKQTPQASEECACGHTFDAHEHYRRGTECSICDIRSCSEFTPVAVPIYSRTH